MKKRSLTSLILSSFGVLLIGSPTLAQQGKPQDAPNPATVDINHQKQLGVLKVIAVRVKFPDLPQDPPVGQNPEKPTTLDAVTKGVEALGEWIKEQSYGRASLSATIIPETIMLSKKSKSSDESENFESLEKKIEEIFTKVRARNVSTDGIYALMVFEGATKPALSVGATIEVLGKNEGYMVLNGVSDPQTLIHEFGHIGGLPHAQLWRVPDDNPLSDLEKLADNYDDPFDLMGDKTYDRGAHFRPAFKHQIGWLPDTNILSPTTSGKYTIYRFDHADALGFSGEGTKLALKVNREKFGEGKERNYWIGYRRSPTSVPNPFINNGAYITWDVTPGAREQALLDLSGSVNTPFDAVLQLGRTLKDEAVNPPTRPKPIYITPVAQGGSAPADTLDVVVNFGPFPGNQPPTLSLTAPSGGARAGSPVVFTATASDPNGDALAYFWEFTGSATTPQEASRNTSTLTRTLTVGGSYTVKCIVSDMKGGEATATLTINVEDPLLAWAPRTSNAMGNLTGVATLGDMIAVSSAAQGFGVVTSTDGQTWTKRTVGQDLPNPKEFFLHGITASPSRLIAVGHHDTDDGPLPLISTSPDGITWTSQKPPSAGILRAVAFGNGRYVAVGADGTILLSTDAITWSKPSSGVTTQLQSVTYGPAGFVAVGAAKTILHSTNGETWTPVTLPTLPRPNFQENHGRVAFGGGVYVLASGAPFVVVSTDGKTWKEQSLPKVDGSFEIMGITYASGQFVAVGRKAANDLVTPVCLVSPDGLSWIERPMPALGETPGIGFAQNTFIAIGAEGAILQSGRF